LATVAEMMFASRLGVALENQSTESLFAEEIGAVFKSKLLIGQRYKLKLQHRT
jgi:phosphoribosylformylglycinamidine synthase